MTEKIRRGSGEEGSALVIALFFVAIFSLFVASVISFAEVGLRASKSFEDQAQEAYAVDGAAHAAINRYGRGGPCDNYTPPLGPDGEAVNGVALTVHCDGPPPGAERATKPVNALLSLGQEGISTTAETRVLGNIFSNSTVAAGATMVVQGEVGALGACSGPIQTSPPAPLNCDTGGAAPPQGLDPDYTKAIATVPAHRIAPACPAAPGWLVPLEPGYYDDADKLTALTGGACPGAVVWFQPGNYYLDFTFRGGAGTWTVNDPTVDVVAGAARGGWDSDPSGPRPALTIPGSCLTEADPGSEEGVQLILGGGTHIQIDRGRVELCAKPSKVDQSIALYGIKPDLPAHSLEPTAVKAFSGFTEAGRALIIGESPVATSEAGLTSPSMTEAEVTLTGFVPSIPPGSIIDTVELVVSHHEAAGDVDPGVEVAFVGPTGGGCSLPVPVSGTGLMSHRLNLKAAPCGLDDASEFDDLEVTYKVALASGASGRALLDGVAVAVAYRAPTTRKPTAVTPTPVGFTNPDNALDIGEQPSPLTADAALGAAVTSASITLEGLGNPPIPAGSTIDSAVLRVAHKDEGDLNPPTVTVPFPGSTCPGPIALRVNSAILDDRVNLTACGLDQPAELIDLTAEYKVDLTAGGNAATSSLDGVSLELIYRPPPALRPPADAVAPSFANPNNAKAIGEQPTPFTADVTLNPATPTASLMVSGGFDQPVVPAGSFIASAALRIAHREEGAMGSVTVTPSFSGNTCGALSVTPRPGAIGSDAVDLRPCGLTKPAQLIGLSATFTVTLADAGASANEFLDGVVLDLAHLPVATFEAASTSAVTGFTQPENATAIREPVMTADAVFGTGTTPATLTLNGFNRVPVPAGSAIDSAVLRVAHRDDGMASAGLSAAFDRRDAGECENVPLSLRPGAIAEDSVDLKACGFTTADQLASLAATYTATPLTTSSSTTQVPTGATGDFTPTHAARDIDGTAASTDLGPTNPDDSVTLTGYGQPVLPAGSVIQSAMLRVAHHDLGQMGNLTVTVSNGTTCTTQVLAPNPNSIEVDTVDLAPCGLTDPAQLATLSVTYLAELENGGTVATALLDGVELDLTYRVPPVDRLDGVVLDLVFRSPAFRPLDDPCLTKVPYDPAGGGTCALVKVTIPAVDADKTRFVAAGTIYTPSTMLDIQMTDLTSQVFSRGLIARGIRIGLQPDPTFKRPTTGIPPETIVFTAYRDGNVKPATEEPPSGFTPAGKAMAIDGDTTNAIIDSNVGTTASLTLKAYGPTPPLPSDTSIDSAVLRVAHSDDANIESATVTVDFTGTTCGPGPLPALPLHSALVEDQVDLSECGLTNTDQLAGLRITYTATVKPGQSGNDSLDGITLDVLYAPVLRASVRFDRGQARVQGWSVLR